MVTSYLKIHWSSETGRDYLVGTTTEGAVREVFISRLARDLRDLQKCTELCHN